MILHTIHNKNSGKKFIEPLIAHLLENNISAKLIASPELDLTFNPFKFIRRLINFYKELKAISPELIHCHQTRASLIPLLAAYLAKTPNRIYNNHGLALIGQSGLTRLCFYLIEKLNIALSTEVIFVSFSNMESAKSLIKNKKATVIGHGSIVGINCDKSAPLNASFNKPFVLGYVGRPHVRKGFNGVIKAWNLSDLALTGAKLKIAGCSLEDCRKTGYNLAGIEAMGYVEDMNTFYRSIDALTLPSKHEGFSYAILEAASHSKPCIATKISGNTCSVLNQVTGTLVNNTEELVNAIKFYSQNPEEVNRMGKNAQIRTELLFSQSFVLGKWLEFYNKN